MTDSREHILNTIRTAVKAALLPDSSPEHPTLAVPRPSGGVDEFIAEVEKLSACVLRAASAHEAAEQVVSLCQERGWQRLLAWGWDEIGCEGLSEALSRAGIEAVQRGTPSELAEIQAGLTGAEAGVADTGTIVVRSGARRSQLASLLPPTHIALLPAERILPDMRSYFEKLDAQDGASTYVRASSNLVFISGPSRTADIEQTLTLGVHGPRELIVVVWG
jgi:L-lactate dehydrogenase complex protein LldG